jgi:DNA-binding transcriptional MerR regulator
LIAPQLRANGRRQYDPGVFNTLAVIHYARRAGFTIAETKLLLTGFGADVTASARWRTLATRKQAELDRIILSARRMKALLARTVRCKCVTLEECGRTLRTATKAQPQRHEGTKKNGLC